MLTRFVFTVSILCVANGFAQESTFETIQNHVFNGNCAGCHSSGTAFARQSNLELTPGQSYNQLVDVLPNNRAALQDGLSRVSSLGGPVGLFQSFLWEKINAADQDHFYDDHPGYGALMPLGDSALTNGELNFIKNWILQGAPETGSVVDVSLLDDTTRFEPPEFRVLEPPTQGIQLHLGPFDVWSSDVNDREFLYYQPYETNEEMLLSRFEISYRPGSHHLIVYPYEKGDRTPQAEVFRDLRTERGRVSLITALEINRLFPFEYLVGSQQPYLNYSFPDGVALQMPEVQGFDINSHSVNRSGETRQGEVYVNLHAIDPEEVIYKARYGSFNNTDLEILANQETTISRVFTFEDTSHVLQMWSHAHEKMTEFRVEHVGGDNDGELIYWSNDWEHPPSLEYDTAKTFEKGDRIRLVTTYMNDTDEEVNFGFLSTDEMQILFFAYYTGSNLYGDFIPDGVFDVEDIDRLAGRIQSGTNNGAFDMTDDGRVNSTDLQVWVEEIFGSYVGDSNLDGEFNSADLVVVFEAGEYEDGVAGNSTWSEGDWNGDGDFGSSDLVAAFQSGGFEKGRRPAENVPEPIAHCWLSILLGICTLRLRRIAKPF